MSSGNLTKKEIVVKINEKTKIPQKEIQEIVQHALNVISEAIIGGRHVELRNFGVFEVQVRKSRVGRNPNKPDKDVVIPERPVVKFKAGKDLKEAIEKQPLGTFKKALTH